MLLFFRPSAAEFDPLSPSVPSGRIKGSKARSAPPFQAAFDLLLCLHQAGDEAPAVDKLPSHFALGTATSASTKQWSRCLMKGRTDTALRCDLALPRRKLDNAGHNRSHAASFGGSHRSTSGARAIASSIASMLFAK
jgi:hypothetical protein